MECLLPVLPGRVEIVEIERVGLACLPALPPSQPLNAPLLPALQMRDAKDILEGRLMESKQFQQMKKMMQQKSTEVGQGSAAEEHRGGAQGQVLTCKAGVIAIQCRSCLAGLPCRSCLAGLPCRSCLAGLPCRSCLAGLRCTPLLVRAHGFHWLCLQVVDLRKKLGRYEPQSVPSADDA